MEMENQKWIRLIKKKCTVNTVQCENSNLENWSGSLYFLLVRYFNTVPNYFKFVYLGTLN